MCVRGVCVNWSGFRGARFLGGFVFGLFDWAQASLQTPITMIDKAESIANKAYAFKVSLCS